jgi:hypothetical protein
LCNGANWVRPAIAALTLASIKTLSRNSAPLFPPVQVQAQSIMAPNIIQDHCNINMDYIPFFYILRLPHREVGLNLPPFL